MTLIVNILQHTPAWVWIVFAALLALGLSQTRTRDVGKARVTILPVIMILLSLNSILSAFGETPIALAAWVGGFLVTLRLAAPLVAARGATWSVETGCFRVPGSWLPVTMIIGIFLTRYIAGVAMALHPSLAANTAVAGGLSLVYGVFAGLFWGRARSLHVLARARGGRAVQPA